jgi:hypothetical protein
LTVSGAESGERAFHHGLRNGHFWLMLLQVFNGLVYGNTVFLAAFTSFIIFGDDYPRAHETPEFFPTFFFSWVCPGVLLRSPWFLYLPSHWLNPSILTGEFFLFRELFCFGPPRESRIASARAPLFWSEFGSSVLPPFRATHFPQCYRIRIFFVHSILYAHTCHKNQEETT